VIAGIGGQAANLVHEKNLAVVLAARQIFADADPAIAGRVRG
jgi:hypothetical protein